MKLVIIIILCLFYTTNCGLLQGLTDPITNELHKVSESANNDLPKDNKEIQDSSEENINALTNVVEFLGKGAQTLAGGVENVFGNNMKESKPVQNNTEDTNVIKANNTVAEKKSSAEHNIKTDNATAIKEESTINDTNKISVNSTETANTKKIESNIEEKNETQSNVKLPDNSTIINDKQGKSAENVTIPQTKDSDMENKCNLSKDANKTCVHPDMAGLSAEIGVTRALFSVGCMEGFARAADNTCQPVEE